MGCSYIFLIILGILFCIIANADNKPKVIMILIFVIFAVWLIGMTISSIVEHKRRKTFVRAKMLLLRLSQESGLRGDTLIEIKQEKTNHACILQFFSKQRMFAILDYLYKEQNARYRVYHFNDLCSWKSEIEKRITKVDEESKMVIDSISVSLQIRRDDGTGRSSLITERLQLKSNSVSLEEEYCTEALDKLKEIQQHFSSIKPESAE